MLECEEGGCAGPVIFYSFFFCSSLNFHVSLFSNYEVIKNTELEYIFRPKRHFSHGLTEFLIFPIRAWLIPIDNDLRSSKYLFGFTPEVYRLFRNVPKILPLLILCPFYIYYVLL